MTWWQALLLGILQGVTEFLPVSSSGHLVLAQSLLGLSDQYTPKGLFFDGVLHLGTLASVILFFRRDFMGSARSAFRQDTRPADGAIQVWPATRGDVVRLGVLLAIASLPAAFAVFFLGEHIKKSFEHPVPVAWNFIILGCILYLTDWLPAGTVTGPRMRWWHALVIGLAQGCSAIFRGLSRSGMTVSGALVMRLERPWAVRFSFLMSMVASLGLGGFGIIDALRDPGASKWLTLEFVSLTLLGAVTSAVVGYLTIRPLIQIVQKARLWWFAIYLWIVAVIVLATNFLAGGTR